MRKSIVLYHANCNDGFAAAYAAWVALGNDEEYVPVKYGDTPPDVTDKVVYILDFSYTPDELYDMAAKAYHVVMLDHHQTAMDKWSHLLVTGKDGGMMFHRGNLDVVFDMERSGAQMAWDWFNPGVPHPRIINHIGDRDLWKFALPGTRAICAAMNSHEKDFRLWDYLAGPTRYVELLTEGGAILRMQARQVTDVVSSPLRPVSFKLYSTDGTERTECGLAARGMCGSSKPRGCVWRLGLSSFRRSSYVGNSSKRWDTVRAKLALDVRLRHAAHRASIRSRSTNTNGAPLGAP